MGSALHWDSRKRDLKAKRCPPKAQHVAGQILRGFLLLGSNYEGSFLPDTGFIDIKNARLGVGGP